MQTIRPKRCLAKGAAVLLLLGLSCPVAADEPTLARFVILGAAGADV